MKKLLAITALLALTFTAFGQVQLSAGAGVSLTPYWDKQTMEVVGVSDDVTISKSAFGAKVFFDATYVEASVGFQTNSKSYKVKSTSGTDSYSDGDVGTWITLAALGKYPFKLGSVSIFPLVGAQFNYCLSYKDSDGNDLKSAAADADYDYNQFMLKGGIGADFAVSSSMFIRPTLTYNYIFLSKLDKDVLTAAEALYSLMFGVPIDMSETKSAIDLGVSVGFKL
jgi:hypothetical protein